MRFLKLELLNLASLDKAGGEVIDFDKGILGESNIFSIVGPTGSGKSTILDAICLALFNRAPRYPKKKNDRNRSIEIYGRKDEEENRRLAPSDCRNILTHGKKFGYSKLTFLANNGNIYRAEWSVIFKRIHYDTAVTKLYRIDEKDGKVIEYEDDWMKLPEIIGLDYDQFLRTVLIAQGAFASFLTAKEDERYELLEKLIGCEYLYARIAEEISARRKQASVNFDSITAGINAYINDDLSEDDLNRLKDEIKRLEDEKRANDRRLESLRKSLEWYAADDKLAADIEVFTLNSTKASEALALLADDQKRLNLHDTTLDGVNLYRDLVATRENIENSENRLAIYSGEAKGITTQLTTADEQLGLLKLQVKKELDKYEEVKPHINRAREILGEIIVAQTSVDEKKEAVDNAKTALQKVAAALDENKKNIEECTTRSSQLSSKLENLQREIAANMAQHDKVIGEAQERYEAQNRLISQYNHALLQETKEKTDKELAALADLVRLSGELSEKSAKAKRNRDEISRLRECNSIISQEISKLKLDSLKEEIDTIRKSHVLLTSSDYEATRHGLLEGEPCPLCGSTVHPYADRSLWSGAVSGLAKLIEEKEADYKIQSEAYLSLCKQFAANEAGIRQTESTVLELAGEILNCNEAIANIRNAHSDWPASIEELEAHRVKLQALSAETAAAIATYTALAENLTQLRADLDRANTAREAFRRESDLKIKAAEKSKAEAQTRLSSLQTATENLIDSVNEKTLAANRAASVLAGARDYLSAKRDEMKGEIGQDDPDKLEHKLSVAVETAKASVDKQMELILGLKAKFHGLKGKEESEQKNISVLRGTYAQIEATLKHWIIDFGVDEVDMAFLKQMKESATDWEVLRENLKAASETYTTAKTTLENAINQRRQLQADKPQTERRSLQEERQALEAWRPEELDNKNLRLKAYMRAREKMGLLYEQQRKAREYLAEWEQIAQAIGAEGKTLRKIAQCYTLGFLIAHANEEIRRFNSRYELVQVTNSLGMRVIDHDRADDVRDTTSLSGGETFIVSLGLALGLSSLSSRNISFDNLFIDEGFGTLDPDTLATVIDSLASLQSSRGKKVGVISHTDTMSERISTQIRIIKHGNSGSSHIEIRNA